MDWVTQDLDRYDRELIKWEQSREVCDCCHEPIIDDYYYEIKGEKWCEYCIEQCMVFVRD